MNYTITITPMSYTIPNYNYTNELHNYTIPNYTKPITPFLITQFPYTLT